MDTTEVKVARLEEQLKAVHDEVSDIRADQKTQNSKLDVLVAAHHRSKGAKSVTKVIVGLVTSGGFLGWLWEHLHK